MKSKLKDFKEKQLGAAKAERVKGGRANQNGSEVFIPIRIAGMSIPNGNGIKGDY